MSNKNTNVAAAKKAEPNTENKNTSLTVVPKNETEETKTPPEFKPALSLSDRLKAMHQVNQKIEKLRVMKDTAII